MKLKYQLSLLLFFFIRLSIFAQNTSISGYVNDQVTGEVLVGANVYLKEWKIGTTTNEYGFYVLSVPANEVVLSVSYIGYNTREVELILSSDTLSNISLERANDLEEVVVTSRQEVFSRTRGLRIPIKKIDKIPALIGEKDLLRALSFFPGIATGAEGNANLYVRGGTPDQNLILLDGIPVYNTTHLGGFVSVFNTDALSNVDVYKGDFPARYGGRLSSVIDITMRDGDKEKFGGSGSIGILSSKLLLEGPLKKNKSSFLVAGRSSYLGLFNLFRKKENAENYLDYWLFDINAKVNIPTKKGKLFLSLYTGNDIGINFFRYGRASGNRVLTRNTEENKVSWGNTTLSTRYVVPVGSKVFAKFLVGFSEYRYNFSNEVISQEFLTADTLTEQSSFRNLSRVKDLIFQVNFDHTVGSRHFFKYGFGITRHNFITGSKEGNIGSLDKMINRSNEGYVYLEDDIQFSNKWSTNLGIRWSALTIKDKIYAQLEPRVSINFRPNDLLSFKSSFAKSQQYLHLLVSDGFGFPNDIWVPATDNVSPQSARQFSLGGDFSFYKDYKFSLETYYKQMFNLIDYKTGVEDINGQLNDWESLIEQDGKGTAYGLEMLFSKEKGRLNGFIAYTLAWNNRQFENLNQGKEYPFTYDRRHDFSIVLQYELSPKWKFSTNWVFQTGTAATLPVGVLPLPGGDRGTEIFGTRNNGRLPNYHRMDVGFENHRITKRNRTLIWRFSVYNAYNRKNPSYLLAQDNPVLDDNDQFLYTIYTIEQVSLFSLIPAVSLDYKF